MFDTELYLQILGLTGSWKDTDVTLDVESTRSTFMSSTEKATAGSARSVAMSLPATTMPRSGSGGISTPATSTHLSMAVSHRSSARSTEWRRSRCRGRSPTAASPCSWSGS